jgi:hypothetical protein
MVSKDSYEGDTCVKEKAEEKRGRLRFVTLFFITGCPNVKLYYLKSGLEIKKGARVKLKPLGNWFCRAFALISIKKSYLPGDPEGLGTVQQLFKCRAVIWQPPTMIYIYIYIHTPQPPSQLQCPRT